MDESIRAYFNKNNGVLKTSQLKQKGIYYAQIQAFLEAGLVEQLRRGYYRLLDDNCYSDIPVITTLFPDAILYLESALSYYGYIDRTPSSWHVAIKSTSARERFNIHCLSMKPHFITPSKYPIGLSKARIDGFGIKIYDRERTICDVLSHKNKLDSEIYSQAVKNYLKDININIPTLMKYSKQLHVEKKVREVLLLWT